MTSLITSIVKGMIAGPKEFDVLVTSEEVDFAVFDVTSTKYEAMVSNRTVQESTLW